MPLLTVGDPAPWFTLPSNTNPNYHFDTVGGFRSILFFFGTLRIDGVEAVLREFCSRQKQLESLNTPFFAVSFDPATQPLAALIEHPMYCKFLWDLERTVSLQYGVCEVSPEKRVTYYPTAYVLDEKLQVAEVFPLPTPDLQTPASFVDQVLNAVRRIPPLPPTGIATRQAPVLFIPNVFDRDFCRELIQRYEETGGKDSGFMRDVNGKTVEVLDPSFKKRRDFAVTEPQLLGKVNYLILRRIKPEIEKAYQFSITRFERHLVACYEATHQGFFNRHRDNTTRGTMHRRFAMSLNLNTEEFEGGYLKFPEYGEQLYRPNTGEAVIFSCSLLHEATPVTQGRRFALLSFFYNDDDAKIREQNQQYVVLKGQDASEPKTDGGDRPPVASTSKSTQMGFQPKSRKKRR